MQSRSITRPLRAAAVSNLPKVWEPVLAFAISCWNPPALLEREKARDSFQRSFAAPLREQNYSFARSNPPWIAYPLAWKSRFRALRSSPRATRAFLRPFLLRLHWEARSSARDLIKSSLSIRD